MAAGFALFALLITVFVKIFPIIAVWEVAEDLEMAEASPADEHIPLEGALLPAGGSQ